MKEKLKRIWKAVVDVKVCTVTWNLLEITHRDIQNIFFPGTCN